MNLNCQILEIGQLGSLLFPFLRRVGCRLLGRLLGACGRLGPWVSADIASVPLADEVLVVHATLDYQKASRNEGLFEKLALEHLDEMFDANIGFLGFCRSRHLWQCDAAGCVGTWQLHLRLLLQGLLLLQQADLVTLLKCELGVLAVDALAVDSVAGLLDLSQHLQQIFDVDLARSDQSKQEGLVCVVDFFKLEF